MKCLIIHPEDQSTTFLKQIYEPLKNKTVIEGDITKSELRKQIGVHDQVLMLGHGSPMGLLSVGRFPDTGPYIIDDSMVNSLKRKTNTIYIWCNADQFVQRYRLYGLYSGMHISDFEEGLLYDIWDADDVWIKESNYQFSSIFSKHINEPVDVLYANLLKGYGRLTHSNPIAKFNLDRLFLKLPNTQTNGSYKIHAEIRSIPE